MFVYHESQNQNFRQPFGAVPAGTAVRLRLNVPEALSFVDPHVVLKKDGPDEKPVHYRMNFEGQTPQVNHFSVEIPITTAGVYFYYFDLYTDFRRIYRGKTGNGELSWAPEGVAWQITVYEADFSTPACFKNGVFYQIFPDRFYEGVKNKPMPWADRLYRTDKEAEPYYGLWEEGGHINMDYYGGDLKGIEEKLPYLRDLGVTYLYLNPIFEAHSNHRYNTADYMNVDPLLGTNEDFTRLCHTAAAHGIRIILDGVFSHTGSDSVYFNREGRYGPGGAYHDPYSPYRSWYDFDPKYQSGYRSWWGFDTLPEVEEDDPLYVDFITGEGGVIDTWLSRGASGFRLDVADELPDGFIEHIRRAVKRHGEDKLLIGEVWEDATNKFDIHGRRQYLLGKGLDSVMNYPFRHAILSFLKGASAEETAAGIMTIVENYPAPALDTLLNFISTHDTERALTYLMDEPMANHPRSWQSGRRLSREKYERGIQLMKLAHAMLYTLPGVPCVYYGDEVGMQGYRDPFNRGYYPWESAENRLRPILPQLAQLRRSCDAFDGGTFRVVKASGGVLHYQRIGKTETADIIINRTEHYLVEPVGLKNTEVNPMGFTILVEEHGHNPDHSYFDYK